MLVMTCNVNGIRAAKRKDFFACVANENPDVICVQEIKADAQVLAEGDFEIPGYHAHFVSAEKKGYSGVAMYSRIKPLSVSTTLGLPWADGEGRFVSAAFDDVTVASLYFPSGTTGSVRQEKKMDFLAYMSGWLEEVIASGKPHILCGDWNIAHHPIDLKNWKQNQKSSGFLPEERAWLDQCEAMGLVDAFRSCHPEVPGYSWWTYRGGARARDVGWRLDYQWLTPKHPLMVEKAWVVTEGAFSDHAPVCVQYR